MEKLLTAKQVAKLFGVDEKTVYWWKSQGMPVEIKKPVRMIYEDVKNWLNNRSEK